MQLQAAYYASCIELKAEAGAEKNRAESYVFRVNHSKNVACFLSEIWYNMHVGREQKQTDENEREDKNYVYAERYF